MDGTPRVGLNGHLLNLAGNYRSAGINWYIYHLMRGLADQSEFDYRFFVADRRATDHFDSRLICRSSWPTQNPLVRILWEQLVQPAALKHERIDLLHALAFAGPVAMTIPWVVTIYDLTFLRFPQLFNWANRTYLDFSVRRSVRKADRIIAISENTKRDLVAQYGAEAGKITVVYCGTDPAFKTPTPEAVQDLRVRRGLPDRMVLFVGTIEPRKNVAGLIRAFGRARRSAKLPHHLVLVGARGWKHADVDSAVEAEGLAGVVQFAGYVPQDELPLWYRAAELFVYPTRYEGFGLPPLEAMASGTPVVTTAVASIPEVVADAAILVSPNDEPALAEAIVQGLSDRTRREEMMARGRAQAERFSWPQAARETAQVYRQVLALSKSDRRRETGATHASA